jgi:hypothetical protein
MLTPLGFVAFAVAAGADFFVTFVASNILARQRTVPDGRGRLSIRRQLPYRSNIMLAKLTANT